MEQVQREWLPHLENKIPEAAYGDRICTFAISLEGWRRGLTLKFFRSPNGKRIYYVLSNKDREHRFVVTRGDKVTSKAIKVCIDKGLTKHYLEKADIPVPQGRSIGPETTEAEITGYGERLGFPLVVKPVDSSKGRGVISNIETFAELREAVRYDREELKFSRLLVEQYFPGNEYRIHVVGDKVIGALNRIPANVIGDGQHSIQQLIKAKNELRKQNPAIYASLIKIDNDIRNNLQKAGLTLDSVPAAGEQIFLTRRSNLSTGGDTVDVTDELTAEMRAAAVGAVQAVPGLVQGGVDMIVDQDRSRMAVIEINSQAGAGMHLFPVHGKARDVPKAIIDYYFPETAAEGKKSRERNIPYFNYQDIRSMFLDGTATEVTVAPVPKHEGYGKQFRIIRPDGETGYSDWVRKKAVSLKLDGFIRQTAHNAFLIVAAGAPQDVREFQSLLQKKQPANVKATSRARNPDHLPLEAGFEIKVRSHTAQLLHADQALEQEKLKIRQLEEKLRGNGQEWLERLKNKTKEIIQEPKQ